MTPISRCTTIKDQPVKCIACQMENDPKNSIFIGHVDENSPRKWDHVVCLPCQIDIQDGSQENYLSMVDKCMMCAKKFIEHPLHENHVRREKFVLDPHTNAIINREYFPVLTAKERKIESLQQCRFVFCGITVVSGALLTTGMYASKYFGPNLVTDCLQISGTLGVGLGLTSALGQTITIGLIKNFEWKPPLHGGGNHQE